MDSWENEVMRYNQRSTNHEVRGTESQGENLTASPEHSNMPKQGDQPQIQPMEDPNQHHQLPTKSNKEHVKQDEMPKTSYTVNQSAFQASKGKGKIQDMNEKNHAAKQHQNEVHPKHQGIVETSISKQDE
ncbi:hypothetical protein PIB30_075277 [Stylosanthes scabra]|uniref:Uncharacterized protein n=1 Tax=Stylosanthes scabra TaxID=79078 RepID=A0ABU6XNB4_9FABA|nr:hypothetical protein [Stylosanthes scabra]